MFERWTSARALRLGAVVLGLTLASCGGSGPSPAPGGGDDDDTTPDDGGKGSTNRDAGGSTPPKDAGGGGVSTPKDAGGGIKPGGNTDGGGSTAPGDPDGGGVVTVDPGKCDATAAPDVGKLALETVPGATGLTRLVFAAQPPGSTDWYFLEQAGTLRVLTGGALKPTPFLDLTSMISLMPPGLVDDERGLLGLAFPADYATSGKLYVMLTTSGNVDTVFEFKRTDADPYVADPMPTKTLLEMPMSAFNHNSGNVVIGKDGMLYVGTGDGGGMCNSDQPGAPQDTKKLFGKILRLDPNSATKPYAAPGNPFADGSAGDPRIWHFGLRNPYRFAFDRATDDLYIGDVGQDSYEELDIVAAGGKGLNFGWPAIEGLHMGTCSGKTLAAGATPVAPVFEADRRRGQTGPYADWISIIGGQVYRGSALPQLQGVYIFGDYRGNRMIALRQCGTTTSPLTPILKKTDPNQPGASFKSAGGAPALTDLTAIVSDNGGEIYFVANRNTLLKIVAAP
jgi:glucose/arabinose dehydrogenase